MNNLRTLLLIPVFVIQISGILTNVSCGSLLSAELSGKVRREIKRESISKTQEILKDFHFIQREELNCENTPIYRKEASLTCENRPNVVIKKSETLSTKKDSTDNRQSAKKVSVITNVLFSGTGNARLF